MQQLCRSHRLDEPLQVQLADVRRHVVDGSFGRRTGIESVGEGYLYDVVLTDGTNELRCLLHPRLNAEVRRGALLRSAIVAIREHVVVADELSRHDIALVVLTDLSVVAYPPQPALLDGGDGEFYFYVSYYHTYD